MKTIISIFGSGRISCDVSNHKRIVDNILCFFDMLSLEIPSSLVFKGSSVTKLISKAMPSSDYDIHMKEDKIRELVVAIGDKKVFDVSGESSIIIERIVDKPEYASFSTVSLSIITKTSVFNVDISDIKARLDFGYNGFKLSVRYILRKQEKQEKQEKGKEEEKTRFVAPIPIPIPTTREVRYEISGEAYMLSELFSFVCGYFTTPYLLTNTPTVSTIQLSTGKPKKIWGDSCHVLLKRMEKALQKGTKIRGFLPFHPSDRCAYCHGRSKHVHRVHPEIVDMEPKTLNYPHNSICMDCFFKMLMSGKIDSCRLNLGFYAPIEADTILYPFFGITN